IMEHKVLVKSKSGIFKKTVKTIVFVLFSLALIFTITACAYLINVNSKLSFDENTIKEINTEIHIFDNDNNELKTENGKNSVVSLSSLPSYVPASFISIEDKNFYTHKGINYKRILKALYTNLITHSATEGASTISQQVIKNTHLTSEKTLDRKIKELLLTKKMEKTLTKNDILETYLNAIYFGSGAYGLNNASKIYFDKEAKDLTIEESAMLAGMIKSPKTYSPLLNPEKCLKRRNLVLSEMLKDNVITETQYQNAVSTPINICEGIKNNKNLYTNAFLKEACELLNTCEKQLALNNFYIFSYYDLDSQNALKNSVNNLDFYHKNNSGNIADSCAIILDNKTGGILAFGGKSDYDLVNMTRSPGSSIKPILVYAPALENGVISPISPILDEQTSFGTYSPQNVGGIYYGYVSATKSVEKSLNIPAIKIMEATGLEKSKQMAKNCGIKFDKLDKNYAIALGGMTNGTTVKELVNSYLPFSNNGKFINASFIKKICDKNGNVIYKNPNDEKQVMSEETAYLMTEMLISGVKNGTSSRLSSLPYQVAGKTGTVGIKNTNFNSDVWSVAYTTDYTIGVWLGNSTGKEEYRLEGSNNGGTYCSSMLKDIFEGVYKHKPLPKNFEKPDGVVEVNLDSQELENNHKLMLADTNTPESFITKANFNNKFKPTLVANSFDELKAIEITVKLEKNTPIISFTALPQVEYKIVRINDDETKVVDIIKNKKGLVEVKDDSTNEDELYSYYIEAFAVNHATKVEGKRVRSNSVKIFTPKQSTVEAKKSKKFLWFE
ncbi:MAG: transglycosylase domain-containing protein, partial [Clostridiales bacterium]|nr:transglycosylase domain-containing protein [Candidatus Apopatousia equi]